MNSTIETMPELLRREIKERGAGTTTKLAQGVGVTFAAVANWLRFRSVPEERQLEKMSQFLGMPLARLRRVRDFSRLVRKAPSLETELRLLFERRLALEEKGQPVVVFSKEDRLPLLQPRHLPTKYQKFRIDPDISYCQMGPVYAECDQCLPLENGALCVVLLTQRRIRFDRYDKKLYKGRPAYRVTAIVPKEEEGR